MGWAVGVGESWIQAWGEGVGMGRLGYIYAWGLRFEA